MWWVRGDAPDDGRDCDNMLSSQRYRTVRGWVVIDDIECGKIMTAREGGGTEELKEQHEPMPLYLFVV
jgi:hypothetical protein